MSLTVFEFVNVASVEDFFAQLEGQLEFEYPAGHNLDTLHDVLTNALTGPIQLVWYDTLFSRTALGEGFIRIVDVLNTAAATRADMTVSLQ